MAAKANKAGWKLTNFDSMFLYGETPTSMMHVASLIPLTPPADAGPTYVRDLVHRVRAHPLQEPFNLRLSHPHLLTHPRQRWVPAEDFDIEYHVRRSALASPGDERELGILVSRLHSHQLDLTRPLWEMHFIEGLEGGRFAVYTKLHHALIDGISGVRMLAASLSEDPDDDSAVPFWGAMDKLGGPPRPPKEARSLARQVGAVVKSAADGATAVGNVVRAVLRLETAPKDSDLVTGHEAPETILNRPTGRNRRLATQQLSTERLRALREASGGTLNDVLLAVFAGALRRFLSEQGELPDKPLVAFVPISIREEGDDSVGNKVAATLVSLATDLADPVERLETIIASTSSAKSQVRGLGQLSSLAYTGYLFAPALAQTFAAMTGTPNPLPTTFNVCISNVPGPRRPLYMAGSRVEAIYLVSIPAHGMALNITVESYVDTLNVGFVGCRDAVPSLQRLAVHTRDALVALEEAYGVQPAPGTADTPSWRTPVPAKKAGAKKAAAKKAGAKKAAAKKAATKKAPAKKAATKKAATKKAATKKAATKKAATKKAPAKKAPAKKAATTKAPATRTATKKAASKKTASKKTAATPAPTVGVATGRRRSNRSAVTRTALGSTPTRQSAAGRSTRRTSGTD